MWSSCAPCGRLPGQVLYWKSRSSCAEAFCTFLKHLPQTSQNKKAARLSFLHLGRHGRGRGSLIILGISWAFQGIKRAAPPICHVGPFPAMRGRTVPGHILDSEDRRSRHNRTHPGFMLQPGESYTHLSRTSKVPDTGTLVLCQWLEDVQASTPPAPPPPPAPPRCSCTVASQPPTRNPRLA